MLNRCELQIMLNRLNLVSRSQDFMMIIAPVISNSANHNKDMLDGVIRALLQASLTDIQIEPLPIRAVEPDVRVIERGARFVPSVPASQTENA